MGEQGDGDDHHDEEYTVQAVHAVIYSGLYLGRVSADVCHSDASMLTLFDGVARGASTVDLHFSAGSHYGTIRLGLPQGLGVLLHHSLVDVYCHICSSFRVMQDLHSRPACYL